MGDRRDLRSAQPSWSDDAFVPPNPNPANKGIDLNVKNKWVAFSQRDIGVLCESTHDQSPVKKKFVKTHPVCKGLKNVVFRCFYKSDTHFV